MIEIILFVVLLIIYIYLGKELKNMSRPKTSYQIWLLHVFSVLFNPKKYFKEDNLIEGYVIFILQILVIIGIVYTLILLLN